MDNFIDMQIKQIRKTVEINAFFLVYRVVSIHQLLFSLQKAIGDQHLYFVVMAYSQREVMDSLGEEIWS